ncbi:MAG: twin-arginine translocase TatA/TatE family subunit [Planctomycetota bacterium]|jgi:sec-independent protein translocase protein TatA
MNGSFMFDCFLAFFLPGHTEWLVLLVLGLLIFGRRLPEVGRSLGRGIVEFKRGIKGVEDEIEDESSRPAKPPERLVDKSGTAVDSPVESLESVEAGHADVAGNDAKTTSG